MRNQFILEILARNLDSKPIYRLIACEISNKTDASQIPQLPPAPESPTQLFKQVVRYYIAGRPFTRDKVIQSHSVYRNSYITNSYDDAPMQFFKLVVRHYLAGFIVLPKFGSELKFEPNFLELDRKSGSKFGFLLNRT